LKEERILNERVRLLEKEMSTLTEELEKVEKFVAELEDLRTELKAFKVFLGRSHPEFKKEFLDILKKLKTGSP
jgi:predicted  nucleic acid-binding Zn-ribbon protein